MLSVTFTSVPFRFVGNGKLVANEVPFPIPRPKPAPIESAVRADGLAKLAAETVVNFGTTIKLTVFDVPPPPLPEGGLMTLTCTLPAALGMSAASTATDNFVELTLVVVRLTPLICACDAPIKPVPLIIRLKSGWPIPTAGGLRGLTVAITGVGLGPPVPIVKVCAPLAPPPGRGVNTMT